MKKIVYTTALMVAIISMLVGNAYASNAMSFGPYPGMTPYAFGNAWAGPGGTATINPTAGTGSLSAVSTGPSWAMASLYFSTGWWTFTLLGARGSAYFNVLIDGPPTLTGTAYARVHLFVLQFPPLRFWMSTETIWAPWTSNKAFGIGVDLGPLSAGPPTRYIAFGIVSVGAWGAGSSANVPSLTADQILFTATSSPEAWEKFVGPEITINPMIGQTPKNRIPGVAFAPHSVVTAKATPVPPETDDLDLWPIDLGQTKTDEDGGFLLNATIPPELDDGLYAVGAKDVEGNEAVTVFAVETMMPPIITDLNGDGKVNIIDIALVAKNFGYSWPPESPTEVSSSSTNESMSSPTTDNWAYALVITPVVIAVPSAICIARRKRKTKPPKTD